ncbi:MAG: hypothetical protein V1929_00310 [bacterium]
MVSSSAQTWPPRLISRTNDVSQISTVDAVEWFSGEQIRYQVRCYTGSATNYAALPTNAVGLWFATDDTYTNYFIVWTNSAQSNATGFLEFVLPTPYSALTAKTYESWVNVYGGTPTNGSTPIAVADRMQIIVKRSASYAGTYRGPITYTNVTLDGNTYVAPGFWALHQGDINAIVTSAVASVTNSDATSIQGRAIDATAPAAVDDVYLWSGNMWSARAVRVTGGNITDGTVGTADVVAAEFDARYRNEDEPLTGYVARVGDSMSGGLSISNNTVVFRKNPTNYISIGVNDGNLEIQALYEDGVSDKAGRIIFTEWGWLIQGDILPRLTGELSQDLGSTSQVWGSLYVGTVFTTSGIVVAESPGTGSEAFRLAPNGTLQSNWNGGGRTIFNAFFVGGGSGLTDLPNNGRWTNAFIWAGITNPEPCGLQITRGTNDSHSITGCTSVITCSNFTGGGSAGGDVYLGSNNMFGAGTTQTMVAVVASGPVVMTGPMSSGLSTALMQGAHAEGVWCFAGGNTASHAEGYLTRAEGYAGSHAEGRETLALGANGAHAEGYLSKATGIATHAEGVATIADGEAAHAEGGYTRANGAFSHAAGKNATATHDNVWIWSDGTAFESTGASQFLIRASGGVGIGTATPTSMLTVAGTVESLSGGFKFPDGSVQSTSASGGGGGGAYLIDDYQNIHPTNSDCVITGGVKNATIGNGTGHELRYATNGVLGGGMGNTVGYGNGKGVLSGTSNRTWVVVQFADGQVIAGGANNSVIDSPYSTIGGGTTNLIYSTLAGNFIGGGGMNKILGGSFNVIAGGGAGAGAAGNNIDGDSAGAVIGGGYYHLLRASSQAAIGGGQYNQAYSSREASIPGGYGNIVSGSTFSVSLGNSCRIDAGHNYNFMYNIGPATIEFHSIVASQVAFRVGSSGMYITKTNATALDTGFTLNIGETFGIREVRQPVCLGIFTNQDPTTVIPSAQNDYYLDAGSNTIVRTVDGTTNGYLWTLLNAF